MSKAIKIHEHDNICVALEELHASDTIEINNEKIVLQNDIPLAHKFALEDISKNGQLIKYGYPIGKAIIDIKKGEYVHTHNIVSNLGEILEYQYHPVNAEKYPAKQNLTFKGYRRKNGEVGIRNELWIVPTVGCVNGIGEKMINALKAEVDEHAVDAIEIFKHNYGCSQLGDDHENTRKILRDIVLHPNAGAVLVLGLGCENNQVTLFKEFLGNYDKERILFLETQKVQDEHEEGLKILRQLFSLISNDKKEDIPLSELKVGLKCGGSDGFSGITANPLLGLFSDFLIGQGGTTVLTEVPEMFGAETILMNRAKNLEIFEKTVGLINDFKQYFIQNNQPLFENPSPGNKAGGISTLEEKSLGCTQKCGTSLVNDVLSYGDRNTAKGLNLLSAPGNDLVSSTALGASGCQMVLFTTGRGSPAGSFVPTIKISSNSLLFNAKPHWIDFNAGKITENYRREEILNEFIQYVLKVASGLKVNHEKANIREIAIFKSGITL